MTRYRPAELRFWEKVHKTDTCWLWTAGIGARGYGRFGLNGGAILAHRWAYMAVMGEIDPSTHLDHTCRNRTCVRPDHLRIVTPAENAQNQNGHSDSKSGRRGVSWNTSSKKWQVRVVKNGQVHWGGLFTDLEEAAEAAKQLRLLHFSHNEEDRKAA